MDLKLFTVLFFLGVLACGNTPANPNAPPEVVAQEFEIQILFTHDGCTVTRFYDAGQYRYYTRCPNAAVTTDASHKTVRTTPKIGTTPSRTEVIQRPGSIQTAEE